jgi:hypothetical protein
LHRSGKPIILTVDMRAVVIGALLVGLYGCGGDAPAPHAKAPPAARAASPEIVWFYRVQGDDPLPDSLSLHADGSAEIRRGGGGAGIKWVKAQLDRRETARATRLVEAAPWKALDGTTVDPGGFAGWDNDMRYILKRDRWSITVSEADLPRGIRPLIRELESIVEDDTGHRTSSLLTSRVSGPDSRKAG